MRSLFIATTGMMAQQKNIEVISNNLANSSTTAFKRQMAQFQDLIYQNQRRMGTQSATTGTVVPTGIQMGLGTKLAAVHRVTEQAPLTQTENPLDLAINGKGYFQIEMPDGEIAYTRDGTFKLNQDGQVVTNEGFLLLPGLIIPPEAIDVTVNRLGEMFIKLDNQVQLQQVGQIETVSFINPAGLEAMGGNLFIETQASGQPLIGIPSEQDFGEVVQGFVEASNVNPITEITNLITAQRSYEMNSKVISTSDEMLQTANNSKR